jgi:hormone-sensitive lipase
VFLVYKFIISRLKKCSNINPKKIILAGDSAGGNLVCSLMALILKEGITPPYAIFLAYPAVDLRKQFTPSKIYSFNHPILQPSLLNLCLTSYIDEKMH